MRRVTKLKLGLVQTHATDDVEGNVKRTLDLAGRAARSGAQVIALQELYRTTYFPEREDALHFALAEPVPGPSTDVWQKFAKEHKTVVIVPVFEKRAHGVYHNSACVVDADGALLGTYRKMHIPDDPGFYEKFYFTPGDARDEAGVGGFRVWHTKAGALGVLVCWDQWFPEGARLTATAGANILFYPTAIGTHTSEPERVMRKQRDAWQTMQRSHAIANGVFVAATNRVGREGDMKFWGHSFVSDPFGEVVAQAGDAEEVVVAEIDLAEIEKTRHGWPFLRDRRVDAYHDMTKRWRD
ncbi:MAG: carbon-nitrogen hydrolase [Thermoplasmatota archaeon]